MLFDIENSRIGIAESDCDYQYLLTGKRDESILDPYASFHEISIFYFRSQYKEHSLGFPSIFLSVQLTLFTSVFMYLLLTTCRLLLKRPGRKASSLKRISFTSC